MRFLIVLSFLFYLLGALPSSYASSLQTNPEDGLYSCPLQYEEHVDISIGDDYPWPTFGGNLETPRTRVEVLELQFKNGEFKVLNPEALPNWLLITEPYFNEQESDYQDNNDGTRSFYVYWYGNWYFGSTVRITPESYQHKGFTMELFFDDNDGWRQSINEVKCKKK